MVCCATFPGAWGERDCRSSSLSPDSRSPPWALSACSVNGALLQFLCCRRPRAGPWATGPWTCPRRCKTFYDLPLCTPCGFVRCEGERSHTGRCERGRWAGEPPWLERGVEGRGTEQRCSGRASGPSRPPDCRDHVTAGPSGPPQLCPGLWPLLSATGRPYFALYNAHLSPQICEGSIRACLAHGGC